MISFPSVFLARIVHAVISLLATSPAFPHVAKARQFAWALVPQLPRRGPPPPFYCLPFLGSFNRPVRCLDKFPVAPLGEQPLVFPLQLRQLVQNSKRKPRRRNFFGRPSLLSSSNQSRRQRRRKGYFDSCALPAGRPRSLCRYRVWPLCLEEFPSAKAPLAFLHRASALSVRRPSCQPRTAPRRLQIAWFRPREAEASVAPQGRESRQGVGHA